MTSEFKIKDKSKEFNHKEVSSYLGNSIQEIDLMCQALNFSNNLNLAKLLKCIKFQMQGTLPYISSKNKNHAKNDTSNVNSKKKKFEKVGIISKNKQKLNKNQNKEFLGQICQNSRNKQISIQYYHQDLKQIQNQKSKLIPSSNYNSQNLIFQSNNSLYHIFKNVQLKNSEPVQQQFSKHKNENLGVSEFLKSISTKSKAHTNNSYTNPYIVNQKVNKNQSPIDLLKNDNYRHEKSYSNNHSGIEPNFFDISKIQLTSKIQKSASKKQPEVDQKNQSKSKEKCLKSKGKFEKVQSKKSNSSKNQLIQNQNKKHSKKKKQYLQSPVNRKDQTDDSLQNLHIQLQYIHKVKESKQKLKTKKNHFKDHQQDSFNKLLQQNYLKNEMQMIQQNGQSQQQKILRSTSQLSQKQIYELMSVQNNKYKEIALKNYFKKEKNAMY